MQKISINDPTLIYRSSQILRAGGIVIYPSETCYGVLADFNDPEAVKKVFEAKQRPLEKKMLVLVSDIRKADKLIDWTESGKKLAQKFWPGPLTIVFPRKGGGSLALRCPDHELSRQILNESGLPLVSTSANLSGMPAVYDFTELNISADLMIDSGKIPKNPPTTIVQTIGEEVKILRQGAVLKEKIRLALAS
jgi:L-threonylcarbamoyladenylate synthase